MGLAARCRDKVSGAIRRATAKPARLGRPSFLIRCSLVKDDPNHHLCFRQDEYRCFPDLPRLPVCRQFSLTAELESDTVTLAYFLLHSAADNIMAKTETSPDVKTASSDPSTPVPLPWSGRFIAGIILMTGSFLVYPAYPVIIIWLPISPGAKVTWSIAVWLLSWSAFSFGAFLAGPQGY